MVYNENKNELFSDKIKIKPKNDWYQTPDNGHPVYIAMHATGTCLIFHNMDNYQL